MSLIDFLARGVRDAERRLGRLTSPASHDDTALWRVVDESTIGRALAWGMRLCERAQSTSRTVSVWRRTASLWRAQGPLGQMRLTGMLVTVAAIVHIVLVVAANPAGPWWLILPGLAGTFGAVALVLSWLGPSA